MVHWVRQNIGVRDCLRKQFFASNSRQTPSNLISLPIFCNNFDKLKLEQLSCKKSAKICCSWHPLLRSFHWGPKLVLKDYRVYFRTFSEKDNGNSTISFTIFLDFLIFYQIFLSPLVKRWAVIPYKHNIYELPNDLRLNKYQVTVQTS